MGVTMKKKLCTFLVLYLFSGTAMASLCLFSTGDYHFMLGKNIDVVKGPGSNVGIYPSDLMGTHLGDEGSRYSFRVVAASDKSFRAIFFTRAHELPSSSWTDVEYGGELFFTHREEQPSRLVVSFISPDFLDQSSVTTFLCH